MFILRVEHAIRDYNGWKAAFDGDPVGRERLGVRRHRILRPVDDPRYVMIDLEFDTSREAEACHDALRDLWGRVDVAQSPRARIVETVDTRDY